MHMKKSNRENTNRKDIGIGTIRMGKNRLYPIYEILWYIK